jgi:hypothetical protein
MTLKLSWNPRHLQRAYLKFYFVDIRPLRNMKHLSKICMEYNKEIGSDFSSGGDLSIRTLGNCAER